MGVCVQGDAVEGGRETGVGYAFREQLEALVGVLCQTQARELSRRLRAWHTLGLFLELLLGY